jgi:predicted DNA-binding protein
MTHDLQQRFDLLARNSGQPDAWILRKANAPDQKRAEI